MSQILLAESNTALRSLLVSLLTTRGHVVTEASNGEHALEIYDATPKWFELVIVRSQMPRLDGVELFRSLRTRDHNLKIVFMKESDDEVIVGLEPGCVVISKPFSNLEFLTAIQRCLS